MKGTLIGIDVDNKIITIRLDELPDCVQLGGNVEVKNE